MKKTYNIPNGWGGLKEKHWIWDGQQGKDLERITAIVRKMPLGKAEEMLIDYMYLQLKNKITVDEKK